MRLHPDLRAAILILALITSIFSVGWEIIYNGKFYPGVMIGEKTVGGKTYDEVLGYFQKQSANLQQNGLSLAVEADKGKREIKIPMFTVGLTTDNFVEYFSIANWEDTIYQSYQWGRQGWPVRRLKERFLLFFSKKDFRFPVITHEEAIRSLLSRELIGFLKKPMPAQFSMKGNDLTIIPETNGEGVNAEEIFAAVKNKLLVLDDSQIIFKSRTEIPLTTAGRLQPFQKLAEELARSTNLTFYYRNRRWKVNGPTLTTWLTMKTGSEIGIDPLKMEAFLAKTVVPLIDDPPQNSRFEMRNGRLVEIFTGKPGKVVDVQKTISQVEQIVSNVQKSFAVNKNLLAALASLSSQVDFHAPSGAIRIPIEIIEAEPKITKATIDQYGIKDLVGTARTSFKGSSADRQRNIKVGVSKLNGLLIAPGEEFSTIGAIGTTSEKEGFVKEFVIRDNKTIKELGGGLCQISTTIFRAALNAGMPITERTNHRFVISYYGPGLDATIYDPKPDFRFLNNTDTYLILQGKVEGDEVIFDLYGLKDDRLVEISKPEISDAKPAPETKYVLSPELPFGETKCTEQPRKGLTASVLYTVRYPNGETQTQKFRSIYEPWQKICLVGTAK